MNINLCDLNILKYIYNIIRQSILGLIKRLEGVICM